jgi:hypothetical protein
MPRFSMDSFERSLNSPQLSSKLTIVWDYFMYLTYLFTYVLTP